MHFEPKDGRKSLQEEAGLLFQNAFEFLHILAKILVDSHAAGHLIAGMEHGAVVALAEITANLRIGHIRVFMTEEHGNLSSLNDSLFSAL